jgi:FMN phosphatase YigB (HAD superfamily)
MQQRAHAGLAEHFNSHDLYPDVRTYVSELRVAGFFVAVAGKQTARAGRLRHEPDLGGDLIATSDDWGAEKPSRNFFDVLFDSADCEPAHIAYVGDRLDNDILPVLDVDLATVFIRRGPWGYFSAPPSPRCSALTSGSTPRRSYPDG